MKASNPQVMVQAYRMLIRQMDEEFAACYPLHLGVTEAGDGEDGRIKSAVGIGTLMEDGIGDTIRVSLTEDPELEIPVCRDLVKRYTQPQPSLQGNEKNQGLSGAIPAIPNDSRVFANREHFIGTYQRRKTFAVDNIGDKHVPVVIADLSKVEYITPEDLQSVGYTYNPVTDKWVISDMAADYIFTGKPELDFALPGTLKVITWPGHWALATEKEKYFPIFDASGYVQAEQKSETLNFVMVDCFSDETPVNDFSYLEELANDPAVVICLSSQKMNAMQAVRRMFLAFQERNIGNPVVLITDSNWQTADEHLIHFATESGALLLDGFGDGICLGMTSNAYDVWNSKGTELKGRRYSSPSGGGREGAEQFINSTAFGILQATRTRISKTEYISCPSCGRTLFDLQETTNKIRSRTNHLKGVKIAIMGCIVNGPGEMADADFGYVGSGVGKITLYKGKEIVKRNVDSEIAVDELIGLLKENEAWIEPVS
jgi:(E)-4-hydroxy-3-methylbut-2-enyl-diphosphate synthase